MDFRFVGCDSSSDCFRVSGCGVVVRLSQQRFRISGDSDDILQFSIFLNLP